MTMPFSPYLLNPDTLRSLQMQSPAAAPEKMSLWDKIQNAVAPVPTGMGDLLGEQDIKNARNQGLLAAGAQMLQASGPSTQRTNFAQIAGQGLQAGMQGYQGAVQNQIQNRLQGLNVAQTKAQMDAFKVKQDQLQRISAARDAVFKKYGPPPSGNEEAMGAWIDKVAPELLAAGDDIGQLVDYRKALNEKKNQNKLQAVQAGDAVYTFDPQTGQYTRGPERHMSADELALKQAQIANTRANAAAAQETATNSRMDRLAKVWDAHTADLSKRVAPINQALMALEHAKTDPVVGANAVVAFLTAVDPKAQQRFQMVDWLSSHLTPSIAAKAIRMLDEKTTGLMPPDVLNAMIEHVRRTRDTTIKEEQRMYDEYTKIHPEMKDALPRIGTAFDMSGGPSQQQYDMSQYHFGGGQ